MFITRVAFLSFLMGSVFLNTTSASHLFRRHLHEKVIALCTALKRDTASVLKMTEHLEACDYSISEQCMYDILHNLQVVNPFFKDVVEYDDLWQMVKAADVVVWWKDVRLKSESLLTKYPEHEGELVQQVGSICTILGMLECWLQRFEYVVKLLAKSLEGKWQQKKHEISCTLRHVRRDAFRYDIPECLKSVEKYQQFFKCACAEAGRMKKIIIETMTDVETLSDTKSVAQLIANERTLIDGSFGPLGEVQDQLYFWQSLALPAHFLVKFIVIKNYLAMLALYGKKIREIECSYTVFLHHRKIENKKHTNRSQVQNVHREVKVKSAQKNTVEATCAGVNAGQQHLQIFSCSPAASLLLVNPAIISFLNTQNSSLVTCHHYQR